MNDASDESDEVHAVNVQRAQSKTVSHQTEIIHETSRTKVTALAYFYDDSNGRQVPIKVTTESRTKDKSGLRAWATLSSKTINLNSAAANRLASFILRANAVAAKASEGNFIVIRTNDADTQLSSLDPVALTKAITGALNKKEIVEHLAGQELGTELLNALRGSIRIRELKNALAQLRQMLDSNVVAEHEYQDWCTKHAWAFGSSYLPADSIRRISRGDTVDLLLPSSLTGFRDLIELKRPNMDVIVFDDSHKNWYWSRDASMVIGQCHRYLEVLHEEAANGLRDAPQVVAYHPRATIVIGRSANWKTEQRRGLHGLNSRLTGIQIITYDQLLSQGEQLLGALEVPRPADEDFPPPSDDDAPF